MKGEKGIMGTQKYCLYLFIYHVLHRTNGYYNRFTKLTTSDHASFYPEGTHSSSTEFIEAMNEHKYNSVTSSVLVTLM